jgi:hypothetical protein
VGCCGAAAGLGGRLGKSGEPLFIFFSVFFFFLFSVFNSILNAFSILQVFLI